LVLNFYFKTCFLNYFNNKLPTAINFKWGARGAGGAGGRGGGGSSNASAVEPVQTFYGQRGGGQIFADVLYGRTPNNNSAWKYNTIMS